MAKIKMPSADMLLAEVLTNHCGHLEHKVSQGETHEMGIFRMDGIPFIFQIRWELKDHLTLKNEAHNFHFQIYHVRPRTQKLIVDRHAENI
jgi:hypothetical protein